MKKLILIAVFAVFSASSAISASLTPSIGISYNNAGYAGEGTEQNFDESGNIKTTTQEYGAFAESYGSIFVELGIGEIFAVGVDYVPADISSPQNASREGSATATGTFTANSSTVQAEFTDLTTAYLRVNIPVLGGTYLKAGFSTVDVVINESMASGNTYKDVNTEGYMAGLGYNHELANGLSIRAEATVQQFDDVQTDNGVTTASSSNGGQNKVQVESMWGAKGTISLVKSF